MKTFTITTLLLFAIIFLACTKNKSEDKNAMSIENQNSNNMKNQVSIVEIPVTDFSRAVTFYEEILGIRIEEVPMGETQMGVLPGDSNTVNVVLVKGQDYKPSMEGAVVYLNAGNDLQPTLNKIASGGGKVIVSKTEIGAGMGYFALFIDCEGNKLGLHSSH